jgi:dTDP-4-dehydrorhamnose 3,5-epimerase
MNFNKLSIPDAYEITQEPNTDSRGFFSRIFCKDQMISNDINNEVYHINNSLNKYKGTVRGFHYQIGEFAETKIMRCISGKVLNIMVDIRRNSPTFCCHVSLILDSEKRNMSYVPIGFANGIQTLEDNSELIYFASAPYSPKHERGIRWDDPNIKIRWPLEISNISEKDLSHPDFDLPIG